MSSEVEIQAWTSTEYSNLALVQEVKKHPCLYNNTLPEYSRKDITGRIWQNIADKFGCSVTSIRSKFKNIRTSYGRYVRSKNKRRTPYYMADDIAYLRPYLYETDCTQPTKEETLAFAQTLDQAKEPNKSSNGNYIPGLSSELANAISSVQDDRTDHPQDEPEQPEEGNTTVTSEVQADNTDSLSFLDGELNSTISELRNKHINETTEAGVTEVPIIVQCVKSSEDVAKNHQPPSENPRRQFILSLLPEVNGMTETQFFKFKRKLFQLIDDLMDDQ